MVEYKFKIGDKVRRITKDNRYIKVGDEGIVNYITLDTIKLDGYSSAYNPEYFELVKPNEEIINNYELY